VGNGPHPYTRSPLRHAQKTRQYTSDHRYTSCSELHEEDTEKTSEPLPGKKQQRNGKTDQTKKQKENPIYA
jgi:hypothetical protein